MDCPVYRIRTRSNRGSSTDEPLVESSAARKSTVGATFGHRRCLASPTENPSIVDATLDLDSPVPGSRGRRKRRTAGDELQKSANHGSPSSALCRTGEAIEESLTVHADGPASKSKLVAKDDLAIEDCDVPVGEAPPCRSALHETRDQDSPVHSLVGEEVGVAEVVDSQSAAPKDCEGGVVRTPGDSVCEKDECSERADATYGGPASMEGADGDWTLKGEGRIHHPSADSDSVSTATSTSAVGQLEGEAAIAPRVRSRSRSRNEQQHHRSGINFRVGARLEARDYLNMWYPSRVIQMDSKSREVLIHFERWNSRFDEWVSMDSPRLRAIARTSARKERRESSLTVATKEYKIAEVVLAKWVDCKMYPAKITSVNSDESYNVVFYDGFEKVVQKINIRKLPPEMVGNVNYTFERRSKPSRAALKKCEQRAGGASLIGKGERTSSIPSGVSARGCGREESVVPRTAPLPKKQSDAKSSSPLATSSGRSSRGQVEGSVPANSKRRKLVVGGIFQAKRHHLALAVKTGGNMTRNRQFGVDGSGSPTPGNRQPGLRQPTCSVRRLSPSAKEKDAVQSVSEPPEALILVAGESYVPSPDGVLAPYHPPKEFMIEEDHNHFKCPVEGCNKSFRKEQLLASHAKHYHSITRQSPLTPSPIASRPVHGASQVPVAAILPADPSRVPRSGEAKVHGHPESPTTPALLMPRPEVNVERKLITEKRRQLLFQRRIDSMCKQVEAVPVTPASKSKIVQRRPTQDSVPIATPHRTIKLEPGVEEKESAVLSEVDGDPERQLQRRGKYGLALPVVRLRRRRMDSGEPETVTYLDDVSTSAGSRLHQQGGASERIQPTDGFADASLGDESPAPDATSPSKRRRHRRAEWTDSSDVVQEHRISLSKDGARVSEGRKRSSRTGRDSSSRGPSDARKVGSGRRHDLSVGEEREEMVNCCCQQQEEDGLMMQCEICLAWQHGVCFDIEEEDEVPERYVCFACENPRGLRESFRYRHNQDWFKLGEMASFRFLPARDAWPLQSNMLQSHIVAGQLLAIGRVLQGLRCKMAVARQSQHTDLSLWSKPCMSGSGSPAEEPKVGRQVDEPESGDCRFNFTDHSYSAQDKVHGVEEAFLVGNSDDGCQGDEFHLEVAANEVLVNTETSEQMSCAASNEESLVPVIDSADVTDESYLDKSVRENVENRSLSTELSSMAQRRASTPPRLELASGHRAGNLSAADRQKLKDRCTIVTKKRVKKEVNVFECQLNLLDHVEETQLVLDHRMDELEALLEVLESNSCGPANVGTSGKASPSDPATRRLLRAMTNDLSKVHRLSLFN